MADGYIQVPTDSTGKKVATQEIQRVDSTTVERQEFVLAEYQFNAIVSGLSEIKEALCELQMQLLDAFK